MKNSLPSSSAPARTEEHRVSDAIHPDPRQAVYLPEGPFAEFHKLTPRHHLEKENEALRSDPANEYPVDPFALGEED